MLKQPLQKLINYTSSSKGSKITLLCWLLVIMALSGLAPSSKPYAISSGEGSIYDDTPSQIAQSVADEQFPSRDGLTALLVFHGNDVMTNEELATINEVSMWLSSSNKPDYIASSLPFHQLNKAEQNALLSKDGTTLLFNASLQKGLDSHQIFDTLEQIRSKVKDIGIGHLQFEITGPAGITADTISLFKNADLVLMFGTIGLILLILVIIYRSPLLAIIPLVIAGMVYQVVDRLLGIAALNNWFIVDKQALSIMMILLFAVLTDYCLFILSRYREQLKNVNSSHEAMKIAMSKVAEPILFSGGTVLIAMLTLFITVFKPYHHFAPVFSVAMVIILLGGLTLIPAVFATIGRKAFWPIVPKLEKSGTKPSILWSAIGRFVVTKPAMITCVLGILLVISSLNALNINYSFNLMKSFPTDISSRQGFDLLEKSYPQGQLAPAIVILKSDQEIVMNPAFMEKLKTLTVDMKKQGGMNTITPEITSELFEGTSRSATSFLSQQKHAVKLQIILQNNPYDQASLDLIHSLQDNNKQLLLSSGLDPTHYSLHFAGQTAEQVDVRIMNTRDTLMTFSLIALLITVMLAFQTRSIKLAIIMIATILLSYVATLGLGWSVFHNLLGYDAISYRLPLYTFVLLVALGVDYNIMLVSRIKEEAEHFQWKEAISRGVSLTGGVISSAGILLAATFCVLMTQPLQELFLFGLTMAMGLFIDTFLVRGILLPSIMSLVGKESTTHHSSEPIRMIQK